MYATQSSRLGVPRHATVRPLSRIRFLPSIFASGFRLASIRDRLLLGRVHTVPRDATL
jgi:hypothetical protein